MEILLILLFVLVLAMAMPKPPQAPKLDDFVVVAKNCPPHKWRYQELKDQDGNTVRWRLVCDICGPLKPQDGPAKLG